MWVFILDSSLLPSGKYKRLGKFTSLNFYTKVESTLTSIFPNFTLPFIAFPNWLRVGWIYKCLSAQGTNMFINIVKR